MFSLKKEEGKDLLFISLFIIFVLNAFFRPGYIGRGDGTFWTATKIKEYLSVPSMDQYPFLYNSPLGLARFPALFAQSLLANNLGFDWGVLSRIFYYCIPPLICAISMYFFSKIFIKNHLSRILTSITSVVNPFFLGSIIGGQAGIVGAYCFIPLFLLFFYKSGHLKNGLLSGLFLSVIGFYDIRILYVVFILSLLFIITDFLIKKNKKLIINFILSFAVFCLISAFWLIPSIFFSSNLPIVGFSKTQYVYHLSNFDMIDFFFLASTSRSQDLFINYLFYLPFLLVALIPLFRMSTTKNYFMIILSFLISLFLAKGVKFPFSDFYLFLVETIPGFAGLRDPAKWFSFGAIMFSFLIGFSMDYLFSKFQKIKFKIKNLQVELIGLSDQLFSIMLIGLVIYSYPYWSGVAGSSLITYTIPDRIVLLEAFLQDAEQGKFLFFPELREEVDNGIYFFLDTVKNPDLRFDCFGVIPFFCESFLTNYAHKSFFNSTDDFSKIIGLLNVKYVFFNPSSEADYAGFLEIQEGLEVISSDLVYLNTFSNPLFFATDKASVVVGSRGLLFDLADHMNFSNRVLYFSSDLGEEVFDVLPLADSIIYVNNSFESLLVDSLLDYDVGLINKIGFDYKDEGTGFTKVFSDELSTDSLVISAPFNSEFSFLYNAESTTDYEAWIKYVCLDCDRDSSLSFKVNDNEFLLTSNKHDSWIRAGDFNLSKGLTQITLGSPGKLLIDKIIVAPKYEVEKRREELSLLIEDKIFFNDVKDFNLTGNNIKLNWIMLSPSFYKMDLFNVSESLFLVFSEPYAERWVINSTNNYKAFGLVNSYVVNETSVEIKDQMQSYINFGLIVSTITFILVFLII